MSDAWDARKVLAHWGLTVDEGPYPDPSVSDDPDALRRELELQRLAAHMERRGRTERAALIEVYADSPEGTMRACVVTPTGDSAREQELARAIVHEALAMRVVSAEVLKAFVVLDTMVEGGEIGEAEAWKRLGHVLASAAGGLTEEVPDE